jgi:hypothetical protein
MLTKFFISLVTFSALLILFTCRKAPPEPPDKPKYKQQIFLSVVDTSVTSVTLKVAIAESVEQRAFIVKRDTLTIFSALCSALDTTVTDTALLPNHNYTYKAYRLKNNIAIDSSDVVFAQTFPPLPISISVIEHGIVDVTLQIFIPDDEPARQYQLKRNGQTVLSGYVKKSDTIVVDNTVAPTTTYGYQAYRLRNGETVGMSNIAQVTTNDTTRNFTYWQIDTLGVSKKNLGVSKTSFVHDVAIINENDMWAVGDFSVGDSLYNAVHWDGLTWTLKTIYYIYQGQRYFSPLRAVYGFSANDVWVGSTQPMHWNGTVWEQFDITSSIFNGYIFKIWGTSSNNVYIVGTNGAIAHFDGVGWSAMQSGTTLALTDVFGVSSTELYVSGDQPSQGLGIILKSNGITWQTIVESAFIDSSVLFKPKLYGETVGVWRDEQGTLYTVGNLMYQYKNGRWDYVHSFPGNRLNGNPNYRYHGFLTAIRGNTANDIVVAGEFNTLRHFNGAKWSEVGLPYNPLQSSPNWYSCDIKGNSALVGGTGSGRGLVMRLWR